MAGKTDTKPEAATLQEFEAGAESATKAKVVVRPEDFSAPRDTVGATPVHPRAVEEVGVQEGVVTTRRLEESIVQARKRVQAEAMKVAETVRQQLAPLAAKNPAMRLVWIRALRDHQPAPRVGEFRFQEYYGTFVEGVRYLVPLYVADHLEGGDNALKLD